jgi:arsenical pump membrane protein
VPDAAALILALVLLGLALGAAVARTAKVDEALVAAGGALLLIAAGATSLNDAGDALEELGPTLGFLAALLLIAEGCRREGLFDAVAALMARRSGGRPRRLLALVFAVAAAVTAVLSLDATVVLLTPLVFATATRLRISPKPHVYACSHLANSASLLLPVSNLTNLLAFHASGLSFTRFAALMVLPTAAAVGAEWVVFSRFFATELDRPRGGAGTGRARADARHDPELPRRPLAVLGLALAGFAVSSLLGFAPVWVAVAAAAVLTAPALAARTTTPVALVRAAEPGFLVFVAGLGVIVATASDHGLGDAVGALIPSGDTLPALLLVAVIAALLANLVNNLPATLILLPATAAAGPAAVLAALIGVNVGPNLTYAGSLATLLWRRLLHREDTDISLGEFVTLGALTVPLGLLGATVLLWLGSTTLGVT